MTGMRRLVLLAVLAILPAAAQAQTVYETRVPERGVSLVRLDAAGPEIGEAPSAVGVQLSSGQVRPLSLKDGKLVIGAVQAAPPEVGPRPDDILPDGIVAAGAHNIARAWLIDPTERYAHGVLGDKIEGGGLVLELRDGSRRTYRLDPGSVFEDRRVRLADLDGDGRDEAIVVQSYLDAGAALAVFRAGPDGTEFVDEVPAIGRPNRWLNPAGVADFDGDGTVEIAYVETPHIGGMLKLYELRNGELVAEAAAEGFSNHAIGSREQEMSAVHDWDGDGVADIALPGPRRTLLRFMSFAKGKTREIFRLANPVTIVSAVRPALLDASGDVYAVYIREDGAIIAVRP